MDRGELDLVIENLERILIDASLETIDADVAASLWRRIEENGYPLFCAAEEHGGFGASFADMCGIARKAGAHALPLPLIDTILAVGLSSAAGISPQPGKVGFVDAASQPPYLAYAAQVQFFLHFNEDALSLHKLDSDVVSHIARAEDGAAILSGPLIEPIEEMSPPDWMSPIAMRSLGALARCAQMAGAMEAVLEMTLQFTQEREQFGRPLAKFQAVQHHLSDIACETAASIAAVEMASDAVRADPLLGDQTINEIAIAKIRCGEAAAKVAAASHQAHGAMGFTREYALGRYTRRLWQWQDEFGSETEWAIHLGQSVLGQAEPRLWPHISRAI